MVICKEIENYFCDLIQSMDSIILKYLVVRIWSDDNAEVYSPKYTGISVQTVKENQTTAHVYVEGHWTFFTLNNIRIGLCFGILDRQWKLENVKQQLIVFENILKTTASCCNQFIDEMLDFYIDLDQWLFRTNLAKQCVHCPRCGNKLPGIVPVAPWNHRNRFDKILDLSTCRK